MVSRVSTTKIMALASKILDDAFLDFFLSRQAMMTRFSQKIPILIRIFRISFKRLLQKNG